jgi:hypothetical protein
VHTHALVGAASERTGSGAALILILSLASPDFPRSWACLGRTKSRSRSNPLSKKLLLKSQLPQYSL